MRKRWGIFLAVLFAALTQASARASTIVLNPVDDGSLYTCTTCDTTPSRMYLTVSGYIVGEVDFATAAFAGNVSSAYLSVNPYALPLFGPQLDVYGFASASSTISISDLASPTFLGTWTLPIGLGYGQDAFFDVSAFLTSVNSPYVDFILKDGSGGTDQFSSTQNNYGHPAQLTVTLVPEPQTWTFLLLGLALLGLTTRTWQKRTS